MSPDERADLGREMHAEHGMSIRRGCEAVCLPRGTYERTPKPDEPVIEALAVLVERHPTISFWQAYHRLRLAGHDWNHKRVYRITGPVPARPR